MGRTVKAWGGGGLSIVTAGGWRGRAGEGLLFTRAIVQHVVDRAHPLLCLFCGNINPNQQPSLPGMLTTHLCLLLRLAPCAACATGNYCITNAADHISRGDADLMLAGKGLLCCAVLWAAVFGLVGPCCVCIVCLPRCSLGVLHRAARCCGLLCHGNLCFAW